MPVLSKLFSDFFSSERAGGLLLIACTFTSLVLTNAVDGYHEFWLTEVGHHTFTHWINDGLMTIFFLLIGLELEREVYAGELSSLKRASLPLIAALGGMVIPAMIYLSINWQGERSGFGIPMATDIAFAIGILSLLGNRVPAGLKIFLTALAVIDDLGAIIVIAIFYSSAINLIYLAIAAAIFLFLFVLNRFKIFVLWPYLLFGLVAWYCMLHSGVHATLAGVLLAFVIPFADGSEDSISYRLQQRLHRPVAFVILPLFALANTSLFISHDFYLSFQSSVSVGIISGLLIGKPIGIFTFSLAAVKMNIALRPSDVSWKQIFGAAILGGIGFTMSIFISLLAFADQEMIDGAKMAIMAASVASGIIGYFVLRAILEKERSS